MQSIPNPAPTAGIQRVRLFRGLGAQRLARNAAGACTLRAPHHSVSRVAVTGTVLQARDTGKLILRPGEIHMAHGGFLLLVDLPEFRREVIEAVAQAKRDGGVALLLPGTGGLWLHYPSTFAVLATASHWPCGHATEPYRARRATVVGGDLCQGRDPMQIVSAACELRLEQLAPRPRPCTCTQESRKRFEARIRWALDVLDGGAR